ncbi:Rieske 2Fe-2S domain-containing protein [Sphingobium lignivorans]|uniref:Nitrite reductase/ring-hydroxylating ferredoxin subunit n=1 Tax=Sphingobium lignivorans TaxID=2735886 RepID=A0ABR6NH48_9SPHN|nr:Rieske 2Fe-2S domain-containing protein [Sphingobium lignivorans]MBB5986610.1 nitrite reductase/ring-hydroxylating ferredoxin subunit [Sphingobium lignivorans]
MALTHEENEALTRVGPGTLMGDALRQYWHPVLRSEKLVADGPPVRVRLLGENFVAFRATDGRIGFFDEGCPHRCASLALAHNAGNGLRCIFHGWKIDVSGQIVHIPTEPKESALELASRVKVKHYPTWEAGGLVWVHLNTNGAPPKRPDFAFTHLPDAHVDVRVGKFNCNWLQAMEAVLDPAHLGQLHRSSFAENPIGGRKNPNHALETWKEQPALTFEALSTPYGFRQAAIRTMADGARHLNLRQFAAPYYSFLGSLDRYIILCVSVPHDDEWTSQFFISYNAARPLDPEWMEDLWLYANPDPDDIAGNIGSIDNMFGQDRAAMRAGHASGFPGRNFFHEDFIVQLSMGTIVDRTKENLGVSDSQISYVRRHLLKSAYDFRHGQQPWGLEEVDAFDYRKIQCGGKLLAPGEDWRGYDPYTEWAARIAAAAEADRTPEEPAAHSVRA